MIRRGILFGGAATGIFVFGIVMAVLGTLFGFPEMRTRLRIDLAQQGNLFLVLYVGIFLATLVAGPAIDVIGNKLILIGSATLVAAGMLSFAFAHSYASSAIPALLLGCGGGGLNTSTNALISDLYYERRGPMLNLLGIFYGIGALCIPLLAATIAERFRSRGSYFFVPVLLARAPCCFWRCVFHPRLRRRVSPGARPCRSPGILASWLLDFYCSANRETKQASRVGPQPTLEKQEFRRGRPHSFWRAIGLR